MYKCKCGIEFEPTKCQLGLKRRGFNIYHSLDCQYHYRKLSYREKHRKTYKKKPSVKCPLCGEWGIRTEKYKDDPFCADCRAKVRPNREKPVNREFASLHCAKYKGCYNKAADNDRGLACNRCKDMEYKKNAWMETQRIQQRFYTDERL